MDHAASEYYLWNVEGKAISVHLSLDVVRGIQPLLNAGGMPRPLENGGILLGRVRQVNDSYIVCVDGFEPVECEHGRGASWTLSGRDKQGLVRRLRRSGASGAVVGWYRTHTRPGLYLDQHDFNLFADHFVHPSALALVVRPEDREATFFFWEEGDIRRSSPYQTFPFIPQALSTRPAPPAPVRPASAVELVAVPAAAAQAIRGRVDTTWGRRALYAIPIAAGVLAGLLWHPEIERRRSIRDTEPTPTDVTERAVFSSPDTPVEEQTVATTPQVVPAVETPRPVAQRASRSKPVRKLTVTVTRSRAADLPEPKIDVQPPSVVVAARADGAPFVRDSIRVPVLSQAAREQEKPSKMRRVIGSIPLFGFLKKKKRQQTDAEVAETPRKPVGSAMAVSETGLASPARPLAVRDSGPAPRTAAQAAR